MYNGAQDNSPATIAKQIMSSEQQQNISALKTFSPMQEILMQQNKGKRKERKVTITIKQQAADGQMVPLNPNLMQAIQSDSKTVFKAQINVDRRHGDFSGNFVNELIKEFN